MYGNNSDKDWVGTAVTAMIGASIAATFAVSRGQNPLIALVILLFAVTTTLLIDRYS